MDWLLKQHRQHYIAECDDNRRRILLNPELVARVTLGKATVAACPIQIDYVRLPWGIVHQKSPRSVKR
jgi:hypothetical protein